MRRELAVFGMLKTLCLSLFKLHLRRCACHPHHHHHSPFPIDISRRRRVSCASATEDLTFVFCCCAARPTDSSGISSYHSASFQDSRAPTSISACRGPRGYHKIKTRSFEGRQIGGRDRAGCELATASGQKELRKLKSWRGGRILRAHDIS